MNRGKVDDDRRKTCSYGFHVGRYNYAKDFRPNDGHLMIVKVNPKDVVAVPLDHNDEKCRVCKYEVVGEITQVEVDILKRKPYYSIVNFDYED